MTTPTQRGAAPGARGTTPTGRGGPGPGPALNLRGAVDLGAIAAAGQRRAAAQSTAVDGANQVPSLVMDVTEASFEADVVGRSQTVPVVIDFWATWCEPCKQLSPALERLVQADAGRWLLAKVDVDAQPRLAQAFGIQSIPTVVAVLAGQAVPLFQGAVPEQQVRAVLDELLRVAASNGVTGQVAVAEGVQDAQAAPAGDGVGAGAEAASGQLLPPDLQEAEDALMAGDYEVAARAYRAVLADRPADEVARVGLAQVELLARTSGVDEAAARRAAADQPTDVEAQITVADLDILGGYVGDAFSRLIDVVRATAGDDRTRAREHLLTLFEVVGPADPRVAQARTALASALF